MLFDDISLIDGAVIDNLQVASGASLPVTGLNQGELFFNTSDTTLYLYTGATWTGLGAGGGGGGINNVVEDTTPQLGGDLDALSNNIYSVDNLSIGPATFNNYTTAVNVMQLGFNGRQTSNIVANGNGWYDHMHNCYYDATSLFYKRISDGYATRYTQGYSGYHYFLGAPTGLAGADIAAWTTLLQLDTQTESALFMLGKTDDTVPMIQISNSSYGFALNSSADLRYWSGGAHSFNTAIKMDELASPPALSAGEGLLWVLNATPNTLMFRDDTGTDYAVAGSTVGPFIGNVVEDTTPQLGGNLDTNGQVINTSVVNGDITLTPNGTGDVVLGTMRFDADQTIGAGQDNYVLTYNDATGQISLEAAAGGGGINNVVEDTTPQLGGALDVQTFAINTSTVNGDIVLTPNGTGGVMVGSGTPDGTMHILTGSAGAVSPAAGTEDLVVEGPDNTGVTVLTPDASTAYFAMGSPSDGLGAYMNWNHSSARMNVGTQATGAELRLISGSGLPALVIDSTQSMYTLTATGGAQGAGTINCKGLYVDGVAVGGINNVVEDTTPQLGGNLDVNGNSIVSVSNGDITLAPNGTGKTKVTNLEAPVPLNNQTGTSYAPVLADADKMITMNNAASNTVTIPANASVAYPVGTKLNFMQIGAGNTTIAITTDTLNVESGLTTSLAGQYAVATAMKISSTVWVLFGNLTAA